ncbi:MAG: prepilin-type N-terminal cleavage/methylation domain-containing protein [Bacilli bacterium]|nr:prepilin-type N-terminal cleavage/methylation domain-containing protein [Bacilli bacterium]
MLKKAKKGFTIVELVIVIAVIGILSAILIPTFANLTQQANDTALKSNLANAYSLYASEAAGDDAIEFVGQEKVYLVHKNTDDIATKAVTEASTLPAYKFENNAWKITTENFTVTIDKISGRGQLVSSDETPATRLTKSTFGDYVVFYAIAA